jgi:hypothetical protein
VTLRNCAVRAAMGMAVYADVTDRLLIEGLDVSVPTGSLRWRTVNSDGIHTYFCSDFVHIRNSRIERNGDDAINISGSPFQPASVSGNAFTISIGDAVVAPVLLTSPGDVVFYTDNAGMPQGTGTIASATGAGTATRRLTMIAPPPAGFDTTWRINLRRYRPEIVIVDNGIGLNCGRGVIGPSYHALIARNKFRGCRFAAAVVGVSPYALGWGEGEFSAVRVVLSDNVAESCCNDNTVDPAALCIAARDVNGAYTNFGAAVDGECSNNIVRGSTNGGIFGSGFAGLTIAGNSITNVCTNPNAALMGTTIYAIGIWQCGMLRLDGNVVHAGVNTIGTMGTNGAMSWGVNPGMVANAAEGVRPDYRNAAGSTVMTFGATGAGDAQLNLDSAKKQTRGLYGATAGVTRWGLIVGNTVDETGSNAGSDFAITRYADNGTYLGAPLSLSRATGAVTLGADPAGALDAATKQYVDGKVVVPSSTNPLVNGAVAIGTSTTYARSDHVHPTDTTLAPKSSPTFTGTTTTAAITASGTTNINNKLIVTAGAVPAVVVSNEGATGTQATLQLTNTTGANGVNLRLLGDGTNPGKYLRANGGLFQILSNNYATTLLSMTDLGDLTVTKGVGVFATAPPAAKPTVTGSRAGNAALASLLTALASYGLITDSSTA